jgi:eukaryotic-like serine/threonine-protein kinase
VVWIADFGLAKAEDEGLTQSGDILGTIRYMAPERFRGEGDARVDVYALGLTLYELLTLHPGFDCSDRLKLMERIKTEEPPRPRSVDGRIPRDLETIVLKAIEKDPKARYQTAKAMGEDLGRFLADEPIRARQVSTVERFWRWARRNPGIAILGGALTALLVLVTIGALLAAGRFAR